MRVGAFRILRPEVEKAMLSACFVLFAFFALVLISDAFMTPAWFDGRPNGFGFPYDRLLSPSDSVLMVGLFAVPVVLWHVCDLAHKAPSDEKGHFIASYAAVLTCFFAGMIGCGIILSGFTEWLSCWRPEPVVTTASGDTFGFFCTPNPAYLFEFLVLPFLIAILAVALAKLGFALSSRFSRTT